MVNFPVALWGNAPCAWRGRPRPDLFSGYLREAFEREDGTARIPSSVLRARLPHALRLAREREHVVYHETNEEEILKVLRSYADFVELCERKERKTGEPVTIVASY